MLPLLNLDFGCLFFFLEAPRHVGREVPEEQQRNLWRETRQISTRILWHNIQSDLMIVYCIRISNSGVEKNVEFSMEIIIFSMFICFTFHLSVLGGKTYWHAPRAAQMQRRSIAPNDHLDPGKTGPDENPGFLILSSDHGDTLPGKPTWQ